MRHHPRMEAKRFAVFNGGQIVTRKIVIEKAMVKTMGIELNILREVRDFNVIRTVEVALDSNNSRTGGKEKVLERQTKNVKV